jgi:ABC-type phosphate transport system substrate-binding protein
MVHKNIRKLSLLVGLSMFTFTALAEVVVIVHPSNSAAISAKNVQRIFLGKEKKFTGGGAVKPINQAAGSDARSDFDTNIVGRSSTQVSAYWSKLVFTGKGVPPKEVADDAAVIAAVAADASAIGYIDSSSVTGDVKALTLN